MECIKCQGLMVYDRFIDLMGGSAWFYGWRCTSCGSIIDKVIIENRKSLKYCQAISGNISGLGGSYAKK